ncbi:hypothetical protein IGB42_01129 [Andreprevotia sp. IGB-42]|uniref:hypothetical protein n=1 Tax=Andreprevotia sp. IGB-42 TaxID=2497473 RepID=UPI00135B19D5|nr:hypothetical protein [Andreprevotia sp. IGB-42]KAF0814230.1 hypothetical protein IGB42_01129 [Andreprevotia sp. IGB-42]
MTRRLFATLLMHASLCGLVFTQAQAADQAGTLRIDAVQFGEEATIRTPADGGDASNGLGIRLAPARWQSDNPFALSSATPLGQIYRSGTGFRLSYQDGNNWLYSVSPTLYHQDTRQRGDEQWDFGTRVDASRQIQAGLILGVGAGIYRQLDQTRVLPYVLVDWQISEQWRLVNPDQTSPTGPAGVELSYSPFDRWQFAAGGAWKSDRFRFNGTASGIGESSGVPLYLRVGYATHPGWKVDLYATGLFGGKLNMEDENGNALSPDRFNIDPTIGVNFTGHF